MLNILICYGIIFAGIVKNQQHGAVRAQVGRIEEGVYQTFFILRGGGLLFAELLEVEFDLVFGEHGTVGFRFGDQGGQG